MARARNIKPSFFQNEELGALSALARLGFIGMWTIADYKGCIEYRPKRLKVQLLPYDDCSIDEIVSDLERSGFVRSYSVAGVRYLKIMNFEKHQNPHKNEREAGSEIPDIDQDDSKINGLAELGKNREENGTAPADSPFPLPDPLFPQPDLSPTPPPPKPRAADALACPDEVQQQTWTDWLSLRKAKKAPVTETVLKSARQEAIKAGVTLQGFLEIWCLRGSQGLQADWITPHEIKGRQVQTVSSNTNGGHDEPRPTIELI